jgi:L-lactate permease
MLAQLNKVTNSKLSIITFALSIITFYKDMNEITENFIQNLPIITVALLVMIILFLVHLYKRKDVVQTKQEESETQKKIEEAQVKIKNQSRKESIINLFFKLVVLMIVALTVITILSINHLRKLDIYYLKIDNYNSLNEAQKAKSKIDLLFNANGVNSQLVIKKRSTKKIAYPYLLCVNGGYIDRHKAENDSMEIKNKLGNQIDIAIPAPTKNIRIRKKINYLVNRYNWFNL